MLPGHSSSKGFGMIDAIMALGITAIGLLALLSLMPQGWSTSRSSDERSRAAMIMHREFENMEALIANRCNPTPTVTTPYTKQVNASGQSTAITGDQVFTVNKTITPVAGFANAWTVTVQVLWPGTTTGVRDSHQVVQQDDYTFPSVAGTYPPQCSSISSASFN
jgi:hypothetical protein